MKSKIKEKIEKGEDVFERGFKIKKINIDKLFPNYIYQNQDLLKKIGLLKLCARKDLNPQPSDPKSDALSS